MDPLLISAWFSWMFTLRRVCKSSRSVTVTWALWELRHNNENYRMAFYLSLVLIKASKLSATKYKQLTKCWTVTCWWCKCINMYCSTQIESRLTPVLLPSDRLLLFQLPTPPHSCRPTRSLLWTDHKIVSSLNISQERWLHPKPHNQHPLSSTVSVSRHNRCFSQFLSQNIYYRLRPPPCWSRQEQKRASGLIFPE